jgi:hypothetical protein
MNRKKTILIITICAIVCSLNILYVKPFAINIPIVLVFGIILGINLSKLTHS